MPDNSVFDAEKFLRNATGTATNRKELVAQNKGQLTKKLYSLAADIDSGDTDMMDFLAVRNVATTLKRLSEEQEQIAQIIEAVASGRRVRVERP